MPPQRLANHDPTKAAYNVISQILPLSQNGGIDKANGPDRGDKCVQVTKHTQAACIILYIDFGHRDDLVFITNRGRI
jgi:hypothetical protein